MPRWPKACRSTLVPLMVNGHDAGQRVLEAPHFVLYVQRVGAALWSGRADTRRLAGDHQPGSLAMHKMAETAVREQVICPRRQHG
jgi:hypothetical protein